MDAIAIEWGNLLLRWLHIIAGIAWIGSSFYFMHLDASIKPIPDIEKGGETWEVHGGGFYQVRKYLVAPAKLPRNSSGISGRLIRPGCQASRFWSGCIIWAPSFT